MAKNPAADIATAANDMMSSVIASATSTLQAQPAAAKENLDAMNKAAELAKTRFAELQLKGMDIVETNAKATFALVRDMLAAKTPESVVTLQQDFFKAQQETALRQFQEINSLTLGLMREFAGPVQANFTKSFSQFMPKRAA